MAIALRYAARSDVGLARSTNQDSGYAGPHLLVIADGMGGHAGGDVASSLAVGELSVLDGESHGSDDAADHLHDALEAANEQLRRRVVAEPELAGMGTTVTAVLRSGSRLVLAHIGDSRAYLSRVGELVQITRDHSYVQSLIDEGRISEEEAESHPHRSVIMRVLSGKDEDQADVSVREARAGDRYLLCSDGLSGVVSHDTLAQTLAAGEDPDATCERLVELALRGGGPDNVSCIVADVVEIGGGRQPSTTPQVVGAAAFHRPRRSSAAGTPAARARALRGDPDDAEDDDAGPDPVLAARERRRRRIRWTAFPLLLVLLLGAGGLAGWRWSQQQYFVGVDAQRVTLYQGLTQDIGPIGTSHVLERTDIAVADLPTTWAAQVEGRISADSRGTAESTIENLRVLAQECRASVAASSSATPATPPPTPTATVVAPTDPLASALPTASPTGTAAPAPTPGQTPTPSDDLSVEDCGGIG